MNLGWVVFSRPRNLFIYSDDPIANPVVVFRLVHGLMNVSVISLIAQQNQVYPLPPLVVNASEKLNLCVYFRHRLNPSHGAGMVILGFPVTRLGRDVVIFSGTGH